MIDREKVIKGLEFTKAMITFNPSTGEDIEPENLNEANKTSYDACVGAIALLKEQDAVEPEEIVNDHFPVGDYRRTIGWLCGKCGKAIMGDGNYCSYCGQAVKWE